MSQETFYEGLMRRQAETYNYKGKLIIRAADVKWHSSPQGGRNAVVVDASTGMEAKSFGTIITELAPGWQSGLHQHTFEAAAYVLEGRGREIVGDQTFDWGVGDTFYLPPNVPHRHINLDPDKRALILQIEAWPLTIAFGISRLDQFEPAGPVPAEIYRR
jgi:quercetin dioxygenase-like cupin family protein